MKQMVALSALCLSLTALVGRITLTELSVHVYIIATIWVLSFLIVALASDAKVLSVLWGKMRCEDAEGYENRTTGLYVPSSTLPCQEMVNDRVFDEPEVEISPSNDVSQKLNEALQCIRRSSAEEACEIVKRLVEQCDAEARQFNRDRMLWQRKYQRSDKDRQSCEDKLRDEIAWRSYSVQLWLNHDEEVRDAIEQSNSLEEARDRVSKINCPAERWSEALLGTDVMGLETDDNINDGGGESDNSSSLPR